MVVVLRAARFWRGNYMLGVSIVVLAVAALIGLGLIATGDNSSTPAPQAFAATRVPGTPTPLTVHLAPATSSRLTVTYYLVGSEDARATLDTVEDDLIFREVLTMHTFEVLVVTNAADEAAAQREIAAARERGLKDGFKVDVQDLRNQ
jgi:hypothetical protein